jgi:hypothetical protein
MKCKILDKDHPNYKLCNQFFHDFKEEDLIWIGYLWEKKHDTRKNDYLNFLNTRSDFQLITSHLEKEFEKATENDVNDFINECHRNKIQYIPSNDLNFLSKDSRLCWFIINYLINENIQLKVNFYKLNNPYFSLLFLIHIELLENKYKVEKFRELSKILHDKKNPLNLLKTYINDQNFIEWALGYTQDKHSFTTHPYFNPVNNNENFEILISYWDFLYFENEYKYLHEINLLKKAWQQKQFRDKGGLKKPYHLPLTKKTKSQLEQLAEKMNISETKTLEKLIENAYKNEMLDEKGKACY